MKRIMLHHGDCLEIMPTIPDGSIDLILCDLPYGVTARNKWDVVIPFEPLWKEYRRLIKDNGAILLTATQPFATDLINSNRDMFRYDLIWYKPLGTGHLNANRMPMRNHESILVFYKKFPTYNPQKYYGKMKTKGSISGQTSSNYGEAGGNISKNDTYHPHSVISISNGDRTKENDHPTQKPVKLMEYLILTYSNEGDLILDNCMGSGTTGESCINTNRNFIGIEKDAEYFKIAEKRIHEAQEQGRLF